MKVKVAMAVEELQAALTAAFQVARARAERGVERVELASRGNGGGGENWGNRGMEELDDGMVLSQAFQEMLLDCQLLTTQRIEEFVRRHR